MKSGLMLGVNPLADREEKDKKERSYSKNIQLKKFTPLLGKKNPPTISLLFYFT